MLNTFSEDKIFLAQGQNVKRQQLRHSAIFTGDIMVECLTPTTTVIYKHLQRLRGRSDIAIVVFLLRFFYFNGDMAE
jgi:hypothetical protein